MHYRYPLFGGGRGPREVYQSVLMIWAEMRAADREVSSGGFGGGNPLTATGGSCLG